MHILRDDREDDGYDLLTRSGAAKNLEIGDRFSLYATSVSMKRHKGMKICTFSDPTFEKDGTESYQLFLDSSETKLLFSIVKKELNLIINQKGLNDEINKNIKDLNSILKKIADKIYG